MRPIFISYRRDDSEGEAGRLFGDLVAKFGESLVFMDVTGLEAGLDFRKQLDDSVAGCGVLISLIGPRWLGAEDGAGRRRLEDGMDFVRLETASALQRGIPVIPVLVHGAKMPQAEDLPDDLKELAYRNGVELTHARWGSDLKFLTAALERQLGAKADRQPDRRRWLKPLGGSLLVCLAMAGCFAAFRGMGRSAGVDGVAHGTAAVPAGAPESIAGDDVAGGGKTPSSKAGSPGTAARKADAPIGTAPPPIAPSGALAAPPKEASAGAGEAAPQAVAAAVVRLADLTYLDSGVGLDIDDGHTSRSTADISLNVTDRDAPTIDPKNGAQLAILRKDNQGDDQAAYVACTRGEYSGNPMQVASLVGGYSLCVRTNEGRLSHVAVRDAGNAFTTGPVTLTIHFATWEK